MATWRPPKTSYWVTPPAKVPGGEDFRRVEENTEYLKEKLDHSIGFVLPSDNILMSATAERRVTGPDYVEVKRFRVRHEGYYRITFELRTEYGFINAGVSVSVRPGNILSSSGTSTYSEYYEPGNYEVYAFPGAIISVSLRGNKDSQGLIRHGYIRNVHVRGTVATREDVPSDAVLQN